MALTAHELKRLVDAGATAELLVIVTEIVTEAVTAVTLDRDASASSRRHVTSRHAVTAENVTRPMTQAERAKKYRQKLKTAVTATVTENVTVRDVVSPEPPSKGSPKEEISEEKEEKRVENAPASVTSRHVTSRNKRDAARDDDLEADFDLWFPIFWNNVPKREGNQPRSNAERSFKAQLRKGVKGRDMVEGISRYAKYCRSRDKIGTPYVQMAATWLNQKGWLNEWTVPNGHAGATLPDDWCPAEQTLTPLTNRGLTMEVYERELQKFLNYHKGKGTRAVDWNPLYANWMMKVEQDGKLQG